MSTKQNLLVGRTLTGIKIAKDKQAILFQTTDGDIVAACDGDCCSRTWVEHIELPALGFPALVTAADDVSMPDLGDMDGCEVVAYYGFKVSTDKGEILIDYRNDSNGAYGGSLAWPGDYFYGGVHGKNQSECEWVSP